MTAATHLQQHLITWRCTYVDAQRHRHHIQLTAATLSGAYELLDAICPARMSESLICISR